MQMIEMAVLSLLGVLVVTVFTLLLQNRKLKNNAKKLVQILELKDTTIANYEASRVAVKDVIENFSLLDEVMALIDAGHSKAEVSQKLGIPVSRIELIIKFEKLKKRD